MLRRYFSPGAWALWLLISVALLLAFHPAANRSGLERWAFETPGPWEIVATSSWGISLYGPGAKEIMEIRPDDSLWVHGKRVGVFPGLHWEATTTWQYKEDR